MKYNAYKNLSYSQVGDEVLKFWKDQRIFEASVDLREGAPGFTFFEGPPSANGTPGIHHVMARTIKDIFCRYKTLQGFQVKRKGGWDTHGLPVELQVEKELGITKEDIGKTISVAEYNDRCRQTVMKFTDQWNDLTEKMGYWVDLDDPYITYKNEYIESLWSLLKRLYDKGLLYKGYTIQPYSPAAGTGLSSHELNMPGTYQDVKDTTIVAMFKVEDSASHAIFAPFASEDIRILAWTTTPWTLPANSALTVGAGISYVLVRTFNPYTFEPVAVVLAKDLVGKYFSEKGRDGDFEAYADSNKKILPWTILTEFKGIELEGITYEQLMPLVKPEKGPTGKSAFQVILGDFVTTEDGTGVVHTSPTFGADDFRVAQANGIPAIMVRDENGKEVPIVDRQGKFVKEMGIYAGKYVKPEYYSAEVQADPDFKPTDVLIAIQLKEEGKAFKVEKYEHPYPHCWRTDKPVLYYPLDSWFIKTTAMKDRLVELNKTINWKPESTGTGRFGNWLENLVDWNLSRSRYWGTPLPIWRNDRGEEICVGSIDELKLLLERSITSEHLTREQALHNSEYLQKLQSGDFDLHRPYVDTICLVSKSGHLLFREPDLIDVWFDSGAMPYAQWHYPFENQEIFNESYPADFISEGVDQTRGWFFTLHAIAGMLFDSVAFKNVVSTGLVLDKNGNKMSKRLGNAVDPFETIGKYGPDATRWYMITNAEPWDNLKFNIDGIGEVQRKFFGTLFNTYNFFALYANLDGYVFDESKSISIEKRTELDRWILSKLNTLIDQVTTQYEDYNPTKAGRLIQDFVTDQLSNWYIRLNRRRFWNPSQQQGTQLTDDKVAAYETLQHCLVTVAQLMSPIAPFFGDWLYKNLTDGLRESAKTAKSPFRFDSVHLTLFSEIKRDEIDQDLETSMQLAQSISSLVHSIRKGNKLKVRQPLSKILIPVLNPEIERQIEQVKSIILNEVNVKNIEFVQDDSGVIKKKIKPNFKTLGPKFGPKMKEVAAAINGMGEADIKTIETQGLIALSCPSGPIEVSIADVEIVAEDVPGWLVASEDGLTVALDISVSDDLRKEGIARDFVNRVQNLRKDSGFDVVDKIKIYLQDSDSLLSEAVSTHASYIQQEVQAQELHIVTDLNGEATSIEMDEFVLLLKLEVIR
ncbi:isoleucyl-tRNA synthetase [Dyadobacter jejuensis]|uniref:Isoleucine--tRNA ligase n=1 Tax=Dyadobacter jejuensis TaxID=1082580 RepID=A0A316AQ74_9BACT|nr:isoleucine--tRNA ligase [Dyadobacter jejuensis]PWJ59409.1 isoleucyl-tRNA synthetase [Dyadobacter jejuensis]